MNEWWRGAVVYQIYPRSFQDTDGDGVGDLAGITRRLDHVARLGADAIWVSPFFRSPMKDYGYDVSDHRDVDPLFGTMDDADRMIARARELGLKVVVDMVLSHTSDEHPWFAESRSARDGPRADWYVWADPKPDGTPPNNWLSIFGGSAWTWDPRRRQYYLHNFLDCQPDLNVRHPAVQDALLDACRFWLDRGVDGFRLDTANFYMHDPHLRDNPPRPQDLAPTADMFAANPYAWQFHVHDKSQPDNLAFVGRLRALLDGYGDRVAVAEIVDDDPLARTAEYTAPGRLHTAYNFTFLGGAPTKARFVEALAAFAGADAPGWPSWAFSNHDCRRVASRWSPGDAADARVARLMLALLVSLRGTVFLYQGEELGLPEADVPFERLRDPYGRTFWPAFKGRDGARTPMPWAADAPHAGFSSAEPWLPVDPAHRTLAVDRQTADPAGTLAHATACVAWRRARPALRTGDLGLLDAPEDVLAFVRGDGPGAVTCLFNLADRPVRVPVAPGLSLDGPSTGATADAGAVVLEGFGAAFLTGR